MTAAESELWQHAYEQAKARLLQMRTGPFWTGELATSALSTATAISALCLVDARAHATAIERGLRWLGEHRNEDGGWGDTTNSPSNFSTTVLVACAYRIARGAADATTEAYLQKSTGSRPLAAAVLESYGDDRTFSAPILVNCALAGLVDWAQVPALPFELAALPRSLFAAVGLPVVSYALPALIAMGVARFVHLRPRCPMRHYLRRAALPHVLRKLAAIQPASGGFLEATPLTAFVAMSLAASGQSDSPVVVSATQFILAAQREDGGWAIDQNLSIWNTTRVVEALDSGEAATRDWLLAQQQRTRHPYTGSPAGGWGWSHLSGSVPDVDDTAGALLALTNLPRCDESFAAAEDGIRWLLELQNRDGGWPTFCRGWGKLPFDRSSPDLTAHSLRALHAWSPQLEGRLARRAARAVQRGLAYLSRAQRADGSWQALWFGSQLVCDGGNPVFSTARVLPAYRDLGLSSEPPARRARQFLLGSARESGGWGASAGIAPTIEETAAAVEALAADPSATSHAAWGPSVSWLAHEVLNGGLDKPAPIGLYFARLWYYEALYPVTFSVSALRGALKAAKGECPRALNPLHVEK